MSARAYLARYLTIGQHRRGRISLDEQHRTELGMLRDRAAARRRHPAGRRLTPTIGAVTPA